MNTQKNLFIAGIALLGVIALGIVFMAGRMSGFGFEGRGRGDCSFSQSKGMMGEGRGGMDCGRDGRFLEMGNRGMQGEMKFLGTLSGEQKTQVIAIQEKHRTQMQDLMQASRANTGSDQTELTQKINDLWTAHMAELRPFVSQDQLTAFDAFVAEGKPQMGMMFGGKGARNNR